jgi:hypothetical protein
MRRPDVEWLELDGEAVLYDPTAHALHRLNTGATAVWAASDGTVPDGPDYQSDRRRLLRTAW